MVASMDANSAFRDRRLPLAERCPCVGRATLELDAPGGNLLRHRARRRGEARARHLVRRRRRRESELDQGLDVEGEGGLVVGEGGQAVEEVVVRLVFGGLLGQEHREVGGEFDVALEAVGAEEVELVAENAGPVAFVVRGDRHDAGDADLGDVGRRDRQRGLYEVDVRERNLVHVAVAAAAGEVRLVQVQPVAHVEVAVDEHRLEPDVVQREAVRTLVVLLPASGVVVREGEDRAEALVAREHVVVEDEFGAPAVEALGVEGDARVTEAVPPRLVGSFGVHHQGAAEEVDAGPEEAGAEGPEVAEEPRAQRPVERERGRARHERVGKVRPGVEVDGVGLGDHVGGDVGARVEPGHLVLVEVAARDEHREFGVRLRLLRVEEREAEALGLPLEEGGVVHRAVVEGVVAEEELAPERHLLAADLEEELVAEQTLEVDVALVEIDLLVGLAEEGELGGQRHAARAVEVEERVVGEGADGLELHQGRDRRLVAGAADHHRAEAEAEAAVEADALVVQAAVAGVEVDVVRPVLEARAEETGEDQAALHGVEDRLLLERAVALLEALVELALLRDDRLDLRLDLLLETGVDAGLEVRDPRLEVVLLVREILLELLDLGLQILDRRRLSHPGRTPEEQHEQERDRRARPLRHVFPFSPRREPLEPAPAGKQPPARRRSGKRPSDAGLSRTESEVEEVSAAPFGLSSVVTEGRNRRVGQRFRRRV